MSETYIDAEFRREFNRAPCPICESIEGCDHTMHERLRAIADIEYRERLRAEDPLWQLQQERRAPPQSPPTQKDTI